MYISNLYVKGSGANRLTLKVHLSNKIALLSNIVLGSIISSSPHAGILLTSRVLAIIVAIKQLSGRVFPERDIDGISMKLELLSRF